MAKSYISFKLQNAATRPVIQKNSSSLKTKAITIPYFNTPGSPGTPSHNNYPCLSLSVVPSV